MTTEDLIAFYKGLLILQYSSRPNALATVEAVVREFVQDQIIDKVQDAFDITDAIGAQLNILGTYRNALRQAFGLVAGNYWAMPSYTDPGVDGYFGWAEYADTPPTWLWIQYADLNGAAYTLTDTQLRKLIQFNALVQSSSQGLGDLDNILYSFFGTYVNLVDNLDMTMVYQHQTADPDPNTLWTILVLENALPHPAGVEFSVQEV